MIIVLVGVCCRRDKKASKDKDESVEGNELNEGEDKKENDATSKEGEDDENKPSSKPYRASEGEDDDKMKKGIIDEPGKPKNYTSTGGLFNNIEKISTNSNFNQSKNKLQSASVSSNNPTSISYQVNNSV